MVKEQTLVKDAADKFWMALSGITIGTIDPIVEIDATKLTITLNSTTEAETHLLAVNLQDDTTHKFGLLLELSGGTWFVHTFTYNGRRFFPVGGKISAYDGKSYGCIELSLSDARTIIKFENVQIQPLFHPDAENNEKILKFADRANDCIGFFSPAIWGALFVVIILVSIMTVGITMMLDIRTMDRFDDPKGKTITINAQE